MKEAVRQIKHAWVVGFVISAIGLAYFFLLGSSNFSEPGPNIEYNIQAFEDLDKIDTKYEEQAPIVPSVQNPRALATMGKKLYVAGQDAVVVLDENGKEAAKLAVSGTPSSIAAAPDGTVFVGMRDKVLVLDSNGVQKGEWKDFTPRSFITSIAINGSDVFVADAGKRTVWRLDKTGKVLNRIGEKDANRDVPGLEVPSPYLDVAVNGDGELWVVNPGKLGFEQYRSDGNIVTSWYRPSLQLDGFPGCCNPTQIAFNSKGELYTCEKGLVRVKSFEVTTGQFDGLVAGSKLFPQEQSIRDMAIDAKDRILVLDGQRGAIRVFALKETNYGPGSQPT